MRAQEGEMGFNFDFYTVTLFSQLEMSRQVCFTFCLFCSKHRLVCDTSVHARISVNGHDLFALVRSDDNVNGTRTKSR